MVSAAGKERRMADVVPGNIGEDSVLDVASEEALLAERGGEFARVVSPSGQMKKRMSEYGFGITYLKFLRKKSGLLSLRATCSSR